MQKQLISFAQVLKFSQNINLKGVNPKPLAHAHAEYKPAALQAYRRKTQSTLWHSSS